MTPDPAQHHHAQHHHAQTGNANRPTRAAPVYRGRHRAVRAGRRRTATSAGTALSALGLTALVATMSGAGHTPPQPASAASVSTVAHPDPATPDTIRSVTAQAFLDLDPAARVSGGEQTRERPQAASRAQERTAVAVGDAIAENAGERAAAERAQAAEAEEAAQAEQAAAQERARAVHDPAPGHDISSHFGPRWGRMHEGLDFATPYGAAVSAAQNGVVTETGWSDGLGHHVRMRTSEGFELVYGHLAEISVQTGQQVVGGEPLGAAGNSGNSTGPHLHFEVRLDGEALDPHVWLQERGVR